METQRFIPATDTLVLLCKIFSQKFLPLGESSTENFALLLVMSSLKGASHRLKKED